MDVADHSATPSPKMATPTIVKLDSRNIDPALSGGVGSPADRSDSGDSARDRAEEAWIENIRVIEALRKLISDRLERKEYDDETEEDVSMSGTETKAPEKGSSQGLYPTLRADDD